jgi:hypothetical protein
LVAVLALACVVSAANVRLPAPIAASTANQPYRLPFRLVQDAGGRSWFLGPDGRQFWSFGVDCVDPGESREKFDPGNPAYASYRLFATAQQWAVDTVGKLRAWGFNSLGGWSDAGVLEKYDPADRLPYFVVLHLGAYAKVPWDDIFTSASKKAMVNAAHDQIVKLREDPSLVGYFSDNEIGWWGDTLLTTYLAMPSTSPGKQRMMAVIRRRYASMSALSKDWITSARTFDELNLLGKMTLRPGGHGMTLVNAWLLEMATYYYALVHDAIRADDPNRLILGDRYCQFYELPIVEASKPYVDVISTNFGATWNDGRFARFFLDTLHRVTEKPVIVTEFYMGATENRSGNRNTPAAFPVVHTQTERAAAFLRNVQGLAALPYVVGAHWFQFYDEPPKGRGDGENFNHGLVDIQGKPYEEMVAAAKAANPGQIHADSPRVPLSGNIPSAPGDPMGDLKLWPREAGFVQPDAGEPFADLYACQDGDNVYLSILSMEFLDEGLYAGGHIPESERSEWTIQLKPGEPPLVVHFGGKGRVATVNRVGISVSETPALQSRVTIRIPKSLLSLPLKSTLTTHSRGHFMSWGTPTR